MMTYKLWKSGHIEVTFCHNISFPFSTDTSLSRFKARLCIFCPTCLVYQVPKRDSLHSFEYFPLMKFQWIGHAMNNQRLIDEHWMSKYHILHKMPLWQVIRKTSISSILRCRQSLLKHGYITEWLYAKIVQWSDPGTCILLNHFTSIIVKCSWCVLHVEKKLMKKLVCVINCVNVSTNQCSY